MRRLSIILVIVQRPWWWDTDDPYKADLRNLVALVWDHLNLPSPTPAQYEIAYFLQFGWAGYGTTPDGEIVHWYGQEPVEPDRTGWTRLYEYPEQGRADILEAFRGIGKSYLTSVLVLWKLLRDPYNEKVLVVSASGSKAQEFVAMTKSLLTTMPIFAHLVPRPDQRDKADRFDVNGASVSQSPSLKAAGITGQITGSRATLIIADDVEVLDNVRTEEARQRLLTKLNEFDAIKVTGWAEIIMLGTPQLTETIYSRLAKERGYLPWILPARFPRAEKRSNYIIQREGLPPWDALAPRARAADRDPSLEWKPTDPERFNEDELLVRESRGRSFFQLQYMLDPSLSDAERYPLKLSDLIVMSVNSTKAPLTVSWGHATDGKNKREDIPNSGFSGDYWLGPMFVDTEWREYEQSVLFVDPSGRGKDETAWAVVKTLNGILYVCEVGGYAGDPAEAMRRIAMCARRHNVNEILVEPNYAGAVWIAAFQPVLAALWPPKNPGDAAGCAVIEAEWSRNQKEARIIDTLEPVMTLHRLVVDESVARDEVLMYQLTHISRERGSLAHEDRVDALAGAVARFTSTLMLDVNDAAKAQRDAELEAEVEAFLEGFVPEAAVGYLSGRTVDGETWYQVDLR
ncbi:phage terminase large subunit [Caldimonas thermodepolymerans]|uniref:Terminase large subunit ribonuclease H-like domain-containing protein n=1 Tax=Caldimonas thermodepolymerans TaxID=215580 RepID=A0A2S5T9E2_9BURK|nr:phage terminase large subunit [Caldimonas thermodepolymerans]PPE71488.1 hypothetical protein C1702_00345 [Caldimonas thermodepolymerans]QPC30516.1 phage terminase large subunit [Caldimonas thermodepolymerans]RDI02898.1 hypothetical protein DES46_102326 [Caldimonas thermodepolymerans]